MYVEVEGVKVGRTDARGEISVRVPSGPVTVEVMEPPASWGEGTLDLPPGGSTTISVVLDDSKEFGYETDLSLIEAIDGALDGASRTLVLRFTEDDRLMAIRELERVEVVDQNGQDFGPELTELFEVSQGTVVAKDATTVLAGLPRDQVVRLRVAGWDALGFSHVNRVDFRVK